MDDQDPVVPDASNGSSSIHDDVHDQRLSHFLELLTDDESANRWKAVELLGRLKDPRAVEPLIDTLWHDDSRVRLKAAWALGPGPDRRPAGDPAPPAPVPHGKRGCAGNNQRSSGRDQTLGENRITHPDF